MKLRTGKLFCVSGVPDAHSEFKALCFFVNAYKLLSFRNIFMLYRC